MKLFHVSVVNMKAALVLCIIGVVLAMAEGQNGPPSGTPPSGTPPSGCPPGSDGTGTAPPGAPPLPPGCQQGGTSTQGQSTTTG
ncbi:vasodilator-stimulated phosphoprotein-like [Halyomorpha halys]|uniref:vasodilator-stimulated phosphoprotein n=1 Tax=Halyomorpha halys TaxID=286706 RepID=UPI0006D52956|nr:vasodilator-stimulated phosphoprotein-like isoform X1 [Halyomorpha halys]XP_024215348.1 vasodilator-stimulated phosphoprotein-like isoform X2 [Halyomorpha halys]